MIEIHISDSRGIMLPLKYTDMTCWDAIQAVGYVVFMPPNGLAIKLDDVIEWYGQHSDCLKTTELLRGLKKQIEETPEYIDFCSGNDHNGSVEFSYTPIQIQG